MFIATRRATVLIPSGTPQRPHLKHLFVLLNDPHGREQLVLIVSVSSIKPQGRHDQTCLLYPGDHPFIAVPSFVMYASARIEPASKIRKGVDQNVFIQKDPIDGGIFARICNGVSASAFTPRELKTFFAEIWNA